MALAEIKHVLGVERVIWIDDVFGEPVVDLAMLAREHPEIQETFPELSPAFAIGEFGDIDTELQQVVSELEAKRREELQLSLLQIDAEKSPAVELEKAMIDDICGQLGVLDDDRWTFEKADAQLKNGDGQDANTAYLIDLNEGKVSNRRGLDVLSQLRKNNSNGVAFILTHESTAANEAELENALEDEIEKAADFSPCITVISKERLSGNAGDVEASLSIALKRAGLRKVVHKVLSTASSRAAKAYEITATSLSKVEPERLEQYVYDRGRREGVSELSVVERALTAGASAEMRNFFATDAVIDQAVKSLRALQTITLDTKLLDAGPILTELHNAEIWDGASVINTALSPLANGDVFCFDDTEPGAPTSSKLFVLLGQPCDIMLRPKGERQSDTGMLVPLHEYTDNAVPMPDPDAPDEDESKKMLELPFRLKGKRFRFNLRDLAYVRLSILDLACFRSDGCIKVNAGHGAPAGLLAGSSLIYADRTAAADVSLQAPVPAPPQQGARLPLDDRLLLTMSETKTWKAVRVGKRLAPFNPGPGQALQPLPDRVTWHLRREGRIRAPYSSFLLERALKMLGRQAFDLDFTKD